jgi:hypothetical protein
MAQAEHLARMGGERNVYNVFIGKPEEKNLRAISKH